METKYSEVTDTTESAHATRHINAGWELLGVFQYSSDGGAKAWPIYALGWPAAKGEPVAVKYPSQFMTEH